MVEAIAGELVSRPERQQPDRVSLAQHIEQTNQPPLMTRMMATQLLFLGKLFFPAREKNSAPGDCSDFLVAIPTPLGRQNPRYYFLR
jgi:hypothetical protein